METIKWLQNLAAAGDAQAQFALGLESEYGGQLSRDPKEAAHWFGLAADQKVGAACLYLGMKYEFGNGVPQDFTKADHYYRCAAFQGWAQAMFFLGGLYDRGKGVKEDKLVAAAWYFLAMDQGYPLAKTEWTQVTAGFDANQLEMVRVLAGNICKP